MERWESHESSGCVVRRGTMRSDIGRGSVDDGSSGVWRIQCTSKHVYRHQTYIYIYPLLPAVVPLI